MNKKRMITGIKPTGTPTLGNYLGVIKDLVKYQDEYDLWVFVADLHALTLPIAPDELRNNIKNLIAIYLACGLDIDKCTLFLQSKSSYHSDLSWVLTCNSTLTLLNKMPQYKNYIETHKGKAVPAGMLLYPSLMSADILLYNADLVPVGADQKPHVDLTRDQAENFNKIYGETFKLPEPVMNKNTLKIMSLTDPTKKMSKSESDSGTIYLLDNIEVSKKKIMKALTDSEDKVYYDPENKPGVSNLMTIYSALSNKSYEEIEELYKDAPNYGVFKKDLCKLLEEELVPIQQKVETYLSEDLNTLLAYNTLKARQEASKTIQTVYKKIGLN